MAQHYDRSIEDVGNIVGLEHVNLRVEDQGLATLFYISGLGLTRDPYMMTSIDNMWVNVGRSQFHLPTGTPSQRLRGRVGLVVDDREALLKNLDVAATTRAEGKIVTANHMAAAQPLQQHVLDEGIGWKCCETRIEMLRQHRVDAVLLEQPHLPRRQRETERARVGDEETPRMGLECQDHDRPAERRGMLDRARQQRLMTAMHAIEVAQRDHAALPSGRDSGPIFEDRDHSAIMPRRVAAPARRPLRRSRPCRRSGTAS